MSLIRDSWKASSKHLQQIIDAEGCYIENYADILIHII